MLEEGEVVLNKDLEPQKGAQKKSSGEGVVIERVFDHRHRV